MFHKMKATPVAALGLAAALMLTGCGQTAPDTLDASETATDAAVEQVDATESAELAVELVTAVPEEYRAAAEAGEGWYHTTGFEIPEDPRIVGDYLVTLQPGGQLGGEAEDLVLTGLNLNTGETTIEAVLPGSVPEFGFEDHELRIGSIEFADKHYVTFSMDGPLDEHYGGDEEKSGTHVYFIEMSDGAEAIRYDVPGGSYSRGRGYPLIQEGVLDPDSGSFVPDFYNLTVVTPEGPQAIGTTTEGDPFHGDPAVVGYTTDGDLITESSTGLTIGDWEVPGFGTGAQVDAIVGDLVVANGVLADASTQTDTADAEVTDAIRSVESMWGDSGTWSPNGRYMVGPTTLIDLENREVVQDLADLDGTPNLDEVEARVVTDEGVVYGQARGGSFRYDVASGDATVEDLTDENGWNFIPVAATSEGTLVGLVADEYGMNVAFQGVRLK